MKIKEIASNVQKRNKYRMTVEVMPTHILEYPPNQDSQLKLIFGEPFVVKY